MEINQEWIEQQRAVSDAANERLYSEASENAKSTIICSAFDAALDALEAAYAEIARLTAERDAALANGEKAKQYWLQANEERDAAINDLTTAMVDMYIDGRGDETHICWACANAKQDKDRFPCSSCLNYEMAEFVHRGPRAVNTDAPTGAARKERT